IQEMQVQREAYKAIGGQIADVAGAGFAESGSALDLLRSSAAQGALAKQLVTEQGGIQVESYKTQAASYDAMAQAADMAAQADRESGLGSFISGGIRAAAGIATLFI